MYLFNIGGRSIGKELILILKELLTGIPAIFVYRNGHHLKHFAQNNPMAFPNLAVQTEVTSVQELITLIELDWSDGFKLLGGRFPPFT